MRIEEEEEEQESRYHLEEQDTRWALYGLGGQVGNALYWF
jgi:hypothetical protein